MTNEQLLAEIERLKGLLRTYGCRCDAMRYTGPCVCCKALASKAID